MAVHPNPLPQWGRGSPNAELANTAPSGGTGGERTRRPHAYPRIKYREEGDDNNMWDQNRGPLGPIRTKRQNRQRKANRVNMKAALGETQAVREPVEPRALAIAVGEMLP
jgi:hypothetical protein